MEVIQEFRSGAVRAIYWCDSQEEWIIHVHAKDREIVRLLCEAAEALVEAEKRSMGGMGYAYDTEDPWFYLVAKTPDSRNAWLAFIIGYLSRHRHLSRAQELEAYITFDLH